MSHYFSNMWLGVLQSIHILSVATRYPSAKQQLQRRRKYFLIGEEGTVFNKINLLYGTYRVGAVQTENLWEHLPLVPPGSYAYDLGYTYTSSGVMHIQAVQSVEESMGVL